MSSSQHSAPSTQHFSSPLSWAVYLACSWTWCIGMFLPVLLVRDYGVAGWIRFAIPNVLGAAAMGWVLSRPGASERIVTEHRTMSILFSAVTLAFHAFFLCWLAGLIIPIWWCILAVVLGSALAGIARSRRSIDLILAWIVLAISTVVLAHGWAHHVIPPAPTIEHPTDLLWLTCVCAFGFLLCPYLDLTFHQARQATTPAGAKIAFTMGFGVFFLAMIFLTLLYAGDVVGGNAGSFGREGLRTWVALHIAAQIGFTWSAHLRALPRPKLSDLPIWIGAAVLAIAAGIIVAIPKLEWFQTEHVRMLTGEAVYRIFMAFYGLVFPAYVWVCMVPFGRPAPGPVPRALTAWIAGVCIAVPMFWFAFIEGKMAWLAPGLGVVLISRLAAGMAKSRQNPHAVSVS